MFGEDDPLSGGGMVFGSWTVHADDPEYAEKVSYAEGWHEHYGTYDGLDETEYAWGSSQSVEEEDEEIIEGVEFGLDAAEYEDDDEW